LHGRRALAFCDNRATWHNALNDHHGHCRLMHRITVQGSAIPAA
jgi:taurine dioxygenase